MSTQSFLDSGLLGTAHGSILLLIIKATIILIAAFGATLLMQRAAAGARHLVWLVTLGTLLLVPALTIWSPIQLHILPPTATVAVTSADRVNRNAVGRPGNIDGISFAQNATGSLANQSPVNQASSRPGMGAAIATRLQDADPVTILLTIWLGVALVIAMSLILATLSLRRIVRNSVALTGLDWIEPLWEISDRIGLADAPRLLQSRGTSMPFACGTLHPTIVLPVESENWTPDRRTAVLLHELAHVRRMDLVGHTLGRVACAVYWFHPLVWTAARRLRSESERACDDLALTCGTRAADYAEHLLDIVTSVRTGRTPMVALAMARRKEFEGRMLAILDPRLQRAALGRWKAGALVASLGLLSIVVGAAAPVRRAASAAPSERVATTHATNSIAANPIDVNPAAVTQVIRDRAVANAIERISERQLGMRSAESPASAITPGFESRLVDERVELLAKILATDTNSKLRVTAAWGLADYASIPAASAALTHALLHDSNASVRETAAWALAQDDDSGAAVVMALGTALRGDASDSVRATAAWALGNLSDTASAPGLTVALSDRSPDVRLRAVWAIGNIAPATAPKELIAKLRDPDAKVRSVTAWALFSIRDTTALPALEVALRGEANRNLKLEYIRAIGAMGAGSVGAIRTLLESPDPMIRSMAVDALAGGGAADPWPMPWPEPRPNP